MSTEPSGQQVKRAERNESYQRWSGATPVARPGEMVKTAGDDEPNARIVEEESRMLISLLKNEQLKNIHCNICHPPTVEAIKALLPQDQLHRVKFGAGE